MSSCVIVAIPNEQEEVWNVSSEKVPHLTVLYLSEIDDLEKLALISGYVQHAADTMLHPFHLSSSRRGVLGPDKADVLYFERWGLDTIKAFRHALLQNQIIKTAYDSVEQYDEWLPHLTLGYPETPAHPTEHRSRLSFVEFDRVAVWFGDSKGPTFQLKSENYESEIAMADTVDGILAHYGVKGQKWGIRNARLARADERSRKEQPKGELVSTKKCKNGTELSLYKTKTTAHYDDEVNHAFEFRDKAGTKVGDGNFTHHTSNGQNLLYLEWVGVNENHRSNGYGRAALEGSIKFAQDNNIKHLELDATKMGEPLYQSLGFERKNPNRKEKKPVYIMDVPPKVKHASIDPVDFLEYVRREIDASPELNKSSKNVMHNVDHALAHYGVKGMKWGRTTKSAPTPTKVSATVTTSNKGKTKVKTSGGTAQKAHADAVKARKANQKLKKSGHNALSNKELKDLAERLRLEQQVNQLNAANQNAGKKFVAGLLGNTGKQQANQAANQVAAKQISNVLKTKGLV